MFSLATNVCVMDAIRIRHTLPSWLRVFGNRLAELVVVVDEQPPSGRIALMHDTAGATLAELYDELNRLAKLDSRVRVVVLPDLNKADSEGNRSLKRWFGAQRPLRCQLGTPIYAFVHAVEYARGPLVLRTDCDMLFYESGWIASAERLLSSGEMDMVEPPLLGVDKGRPATAVSSRAFMLHKDRFATKLPIRAHKLDAVRRVHRWLKGRPPWVCLEEMLSIEKRAGRIKHGFLDTGSGFSMHVSTRQEMSVPWFHKVVPCVERGEVPDAQCDHGPNYLAGAWSKFVEDHTRFKR